MAYFVLAVSIVFTVASQLLLKKGSLTLKEIEFSFGSLWKIVLAFFGNFYLFFGLVLFGLAFILWVFVLSKLELSVAYPISTSLNLMLVTLISYIWLSESLSAIQFVGIFSIIAGIFLLLWRA